MKVLGNNIHAAPVKIDYIGAVVIPEAVSIRQNYSLWTCLQSGPGRVNRKGMLIPTEVEPGDRMVCQFQHNGSAELPDGTAIINEEQVLAVIPRMS